MIRRLTKQVLLTLSAVLLSGCLSEANLELADSSRLPGWFSIPEGDSRADYRVTIDLYIYSKRVAVLKLYKKGWPFRVKRVVGVMDARALPERGGVYPIYEAITVDGMTEIMEQKRPEAKVYVSDDPDIRAKFDANRRR